MSNQAKKVWEEVKEKGGLSWEEVGLGHQHQFTELVSLGGDATPLGVKVARSLEKLSPKQLIPLSEVFAEKPVKVTDVKSPELSPKATAILDSILLGSGVKTETPVVPTKKKVEKSFPTAAKKKK